MPFQFYTYSCWIWIYLLLVCVFLLFTIYGSAQCASRRFSRNIDDDLFLYRNDHTWIIWKTFDGWIHRNRPLRYSSCIHSVLLWAPCSFKLYSHISNVRQRLWNAALIFFNIWWIITHNYWLDRQKKSVQTNNSNIISWTISVWFADKILASQINWLTISKATVSLY